MANFTYPISCMVLPRGVNTIQKSSMSLTITLFGLDLGEYLKNTSSISHC